jgi:outer membrane protein
MIVAAIGAALLATTPNPTSGPVVAAVSAPAPTRTLRLTPAQMFRLAEIAQEHSDADTAAAVYIALEANPDADIRAEARFRHAKQLVGEKRNRDAALLLRRLLDEQPRAVPARLELARALQLLGDVGGALRELRAVQSSGLPPEVARLVDRYSQALRATRPAGGSFEIALAPNSNINSATRSDTLGTIFGDFDIDSKSKARSGTGLAARGQAFRRVPLGSSKSSILVTLASSADLYRQMKFSDIALDLAAGPELRIGANQLNLELGATERWYGGKPFLRSARAGATLMRPIGSLTQLRLQGSAALIDNRVNDLQDGKSYSARIDVEHALSPTTGIGFNLSGERQALNDPGYATKGWRAGIIGWRELGRMTLTAEATFGRLAADERLVLFPDRRSDRYERLSLGATFRQLQFRGFAPLFRVSFERNRSTIAFYDFRRTKTELGIARAF